MTPATVNLRVDRTKAVRRIISVTGLDLTSASFRAMVRLYPDAPGDPILDLPLVTNTDDGMKFLSVETVNDVPVSLIQMQVAAATMASDPPAAPIGKTSVNFAWDLCITPSGGIEEVYARGVFQVDGVVTYD